MEFHVKSIKAFSFFNLFIFLVSYTSYSLAENYFSKEEEVSYKTHSGLWRSAVIKGECDSDRYRISCDGRSFLVSKSSLKKRERRGSRLLRASAVRWIFAKDLPPKDKLKESPLVPLSFDEK